MLIRNATVFGTADTDVRWVGGHITECGRGLRPMSGEDDIDARGGWLVPGLHDHHVHLRSLAARSGSIQFGPPRVRTAAELLNRLRSADRELPPHDWIRGVGYHESVAGDLDRARLDGMPTARPVRIQHRSGAVWMLNSRACELLDVDECSLAGVERDPAGHATGRLWRMDAWLGERIGARSPDLSGIATRAAALGITGFTDATPDLGQSDIDDLADRVADGAIPQRVHCMAAPNIAAPRVGRFSLGPNKIILDDTTLPALDEFTATLRELHAVGKPAAVHCVTRVQLVLTMAALETAGVIAGDRIEHGAIIPAESMAWLAEHGVPVITQPHFPVERAEQYAQEVPDEDRPDLWRLGSLLAAGVGVAAGTDAPFGGPDPWPVVRAAIDRGSESPAAETISPIAALALFFGEPARPQLGRTIAPGRIADLTLLRTPPSEFPDALDTDLVAATVVEGRPVYLAP
ncbi:amidohydrolase family protein [Nocardia sp. KC 131]|uniref:amidohydrolase family protein n=1 Tax=Nocardia arseniciresistens TaxID=3392119 RepID=UPI00398F6610